MSGQPEVPSLAGLERRRQELDKRHGPWRPRTLPDLLDAVAGSHPDSEFVVDEWQTVRYLELVDWSRRIARGLVQRGIAPGDRVALLLTNRAEAVAARFAIAYAGAVVVPINVLLKARELRDVLASSGAVALVTMERIRSTDTLAALDTLAPGWDDGRPGGSDLPALRLVVTVPPYGAAPRRAGATTLADLERAPDPRGDAELARRAAAMDPADASSIFYTSGTTGLPKGVQLTHDMELRSGYGSAYTRGFEDGRRILFALPLHHVFAYIEGMIAALFVGGTIIVSEGFDPDATLAAIAEHRAGEALFVPTMSLAVVEAARRTAYDLSSLHSVMSAAQAAPARLWEDLRTVLGLEQLVTGYGMTETTAATTFTEPGGSLADLVETVGAAKRGGVAGDPELDGRLVGYKTVHPLTGEDLPAGAEGELAARGPIVVTGYLDDADSDAALPGGWLRSGDLGRVRADGFLQLTGRSKDIYKCGGELVMPVEVESVLTSRPEVSQAYVVGVPHERMGEVGCAWVVPAAGAEVDAAALLEVCREELARFKVPRHVIVTSAADLPLTASGKVQKFRLAEQAAERLRARS